MNNKLPPAALVVTYTIADWDTWKAAFDSNEGMRKEHGFKGHHLNRGADDPNLISIYLAVADVDAAKAFLASPELKSTMDKAGITGPPKFTWATPLREEVVWDRELPAMIVTHKVEDFDKWLASYDGSSDFQKACGIIGQAANRSIDDPSTVIIYHQAESFDTLKKFLSHPELKDAMEKAGVTSEPKVTFYSGGWGKLYG